MIHLRLDVLPLVLLQARDVDLGIEVADVAHDRVVLHANHMVVRDHVDVSGCGDEDVALVRRVVHGDDAIAFHRRLQCADRVDLGHPDRSAEAAQRLRAALADVAITSHDCDLARDHHIGRALDAVHERLAASIEVVELRLRDRIVHVDRRERQASLFLHLIEAMHAGRRFLRYALDARERFRVPARFGSTALAHRGEQRCLFLVGRLRYDGRIFLGCAPR